MWRLMAADGGGSKPRAARGVRGVDPRPLSLVMAFAVWRRVRASRRRAESTQRSTFRSCGGLASGWRRLSCAAVGGGRGGSGGNGDSTSPSSLALDLGCLPPLGATLTSRRRVGDVLGDVHSSMARSSDSMKRGDMAPFHPPGRPTP